MCLASWIANPATPPAPPWISTVSPALICSVSSTDISAVRAARPAAAHSICEKRSGLRATRSWRSAIFSAYAPSAGTSHTPKTASPGRKSRAPSPTAATTPEKSRPGTCGRATLTGYCPARCFQSAAFTLAAWMSTSTSPRAGAGAGSSPYSRTSGGPWRRKKAAFIANLVLRHVDRDAADRGQVLVAPAQLDHVVVGVAHEHRDMAVAAEGHGSLRDANAVFAQRHDRRLDRGDAQCDMGVAGILLAHVHEDVLPAGVGVRVVDEVELHVVLVPDDRHRVVGGFGVQREPQHGVELHGPLQITYSDADVVYPRDVDRRLAAHVRDIKEKFRFRALSRVR